MMQSSVVDSVARWMGILSSGLLIGSEAEEAVVRARRVLGASQLLELRAFFDGLGHEAALDAKAAVIETCIAAAHADGRLVDAERELLEEMVRLGDLDEASAAALSARIDGSPDLDALVARLPHPALRELVLVMVWQILTADGEVDRAEQRAYKGLADKLGVGPERAAILRTILRNDAAGGVSEA